METEEQYVERVLKMPREMVTEVYCSLDPENVFTETAIRFGTLLSDESVEALAQNDFHDGPENLAFLPEGA